MYGDLDTIINLEQAQEFTNLINMRKQVASASWGYFHSALILENKVISSDQI